MINNHLKIRKIGSSRSEKTYTSNILNKKLNITIF